jgi:hypothetical protein
MPNYKLPQMAKDFEPQLRKLTESIPELQRAASERESELFRRRTLLQEEDAARQIGNLLSLFFSSFLFLLFSILSFSSPLLPCCF